jgi:Caspase domain/Putative peptidoglycan binding domain
VTFASLNIRNLICAVATSAAVFMAAPASAERRVAIVIGNGAYKSVTPLPNPSMDAKAMAEMLRSMDFDVVEGTDLGRDAMTDRLRDFAAKSAGADVALFFYAGHGMSVGGKNYLIPVDADLKSELDITFGGPINVEDTIAQTMGDAKTKLVLLDACRDNPFAARIRSVGQRKRTTEISSGLAKMESSRGTLIAFATAPGNTALDGKAGEHSPFTKALLANVTEPGLEIRLALTKVRAQVAEETRETQVPWENTNLTGFFYMNPVKVAALPNAGIGAGPQTGGSLVGTAAEIEYWKTVKDSNKIEELKSYIFKFPNGTYVGLARSRIAELQAADTARAAAGSPESERKLGLASDERRDVQRRLLALGFYEGRADGRFGRQVRDAIERWQEEHNYPKSGYFTKPQYEALLAAELPAPRSIEPSEPRQSAPRHIERPRHRGHGFHPGIPRQFRGLIPGGLGFRF